MPRVQRLFERRQPSTSGDLKLPACLALLTIAFVVAAGLALWSGEERRVAGLPARTRA